MQDYIRIACAVPPVAVGDVDKNTSDICTMIAEADSRQVDLLVFPELALTGYSCGDLFFQRSLQDAVRDGLQRILQCTLDHQCITVVVGLPYVIDGQLYNCAAVISSGQLWGLVPKSYIPDDGLFNEKRWFAAAWDLCDAPIEASQLGLDGDYSVTLGVNNYFSISGNVKVGVEICEDLFVPTPPSSALVLGGAEVIVNLAASNETVGKRAFRRDMVKHQSAAGICAYAFCSAGTTESTQNTVCSGHSLICQGGKILAENAKIADTDYMLVTDVDLGLIRADRMRKTSFRDAATHYGKQFEITCCPCFAPPLRSNGNLYKLSKIPFVPDSLEERTERCKEIFQIQVAGLKRRLSMIGVNAVIGISGGLDSTLALLVAVEAMRQLGRPVTDVHGITMPCFGTSDRTYNNAWSLIRTLGVTGREIDIKEAVSVHFRDIGHDPRCHDATYENAQARERTQVLMDYAGQVGGIVVGTGDMSELALGWCTYNGDHMSMYGVNGSVPKTLMRWIIDAVAHTEAFSAAKDVLMDIIDTPISPELLPPDTKGLISQQTEDIVGPYVLHDFFLYYMLRYGFSPTKIYQMACGAFCDDFDRETVKKWLLTFYRRFFSQQFKRNCQPDGVAVGSVGMSPRGDLQMPSDAVASIWLREIEKL